MISSFFLSILFEYCFFSRKIYFDTNKNIIDKNSDSKKGEIVLNMSLLYLVVVCVSSLSMFFVMSCNFWIILSLIIGHAVGLYIFGLGQIEKENNEKYYKVSEVAI